MLNESASYVMILFSLFQYLMHGNSPNERIGYNWIFLHDAQSSYNRSIAVYPIVT